jgi:hypothetical protein
MNFVFRIFGVPHGFELYQGAEDEQNYFQLFYNESKENVKLTIHRKTSGRVSYSYLRYNFVSGSGRPNAFFGMSVVFTNEYCFDVENLFNLFDSVYKTILQRKILIEEIQGNPNLQAKYLILSFADADSEVKRIENIICKNIENEFANDIRPLDSSFKQEYPNLTRKLNRKSKNPVFLNDLHKYSWVDISSDYSEEINLDHEKIAELKKRITDLGGNISTNFINKTVKKAFKQIEEDKSYISPYLKIQPELQEIDKALDNIQKQLRDLEQNAILKKDIPRNSGRDQNKTEEVVEERVKSEIEQDEVKKEREKSENKDILQNAGIESASSKPHTLKNPLSNIWNKIKKTGWRKFGLFFIAVVLVTVAFLYYNYKPNNTTEKVEIVTSSPPAEDSPKNLLEEGNNALERNNFDEAINIFEEAGRTDLIDIANAKAVEYWQEQAGEKAGDKKWQEAIACLENTKKYGGYGALDGDIEGFQKEIEAEQKFRQQKKDKKKDTKASPAPPDTNITIQLSENKRFSVGDKFTATAKCGQSKCEGGEWRYEEGIFANKSDNPTTVEIKSVPHNGRVILSYSINNQKVTVEIRIDP